MKPHPKATSQEPKPHTVSPAPRKKKTSSRSDTRRNLNAQVESQALLAWESLQEAFPRLRMTSGIAGITADFDVEAGTTETTQALARAHQTEAHQQQVRERAIACLATPQGPDNPQDPADPSQQVGLLHKLLWAATPRTEAERKALYRQLDTLMADFYIACRELGFFFLVESAALRHQLGIWVMMAKLGNPQAYHLMRKIFDAVLWVGPGKPQTLSAA